MSRRRCSRFYPFRHLRLAMTSLIPLAGSIAVVDHASVASAEERRADLLAYDIFTTSAPRPPLSVPNAGAKVDHSQTAGRTKLPRERELPLRTQQVPHPSAVMFPPVTPLE
jgi:hypothetical protein